MANSLSESCSYACWGKLIRFGGVVISLEVWWIKHKKPKYLWWSNAPYGGKCQSFIRVRCPYFHVSFYFCLFLKIYMYEIHKSISFHEIKCDGIRSFMDFMCIFVWMILIVVHAKVIKLTCICFQQPSENVDIRTMENIQKETDLSETRIFDCGFELLNWTRSFKRRTLGLTP